ncbi:MAG: hypothetical protein FJ098_10985, partial [Deltaproteobacteria bacterium]|nr:hypothetical protein [Deltaproteobacteria bacterium]
MERGVMRGVTVEPEAAAPGARCLALGPLDRIYRALCAILYNYAPLSGHPGGSLSSGPLAQALVFRALDLDLSAPDRDDADRLVYAAGHKALGLYALWALRDEVARIGAPRLLPADPRQRLRLEDLLGFRRNPVNLGEPARSLGTRALDGHPTPATPFVPLATGASGVGLAASVGLALSLRDRYGPAAPRVHVLEGEGGLTPGRVAEALAAAATAGLDNLVLHVDWNQASIDSDRVCPEGDEPGDYVCWDPMDLARVHGWNVVPARDGADPAAIRVAQAAALGLQNGRPTAVVYRTVKGRGYGLEGRRSHGAGHALCSAGFRAAIAALGPGLADALPCCGARDCEGGSRREVLDRCAWDALRAVRGALEGERAAVAVLAAALEESRARLDARGRRPRDDAPDRDRLFAAAAAAPPAELLPVPGEKATLRAALGDALGHLGRAGRGAVLVAAADLLDSTSVGLAAEGFPGGFWRARDNPGSRRLSVGGICEDAMTGILSGLAAGGGHLGAGASYAAFLAPLGHVAGRLHAIGMAARRERLPGCPSDPIVLVCGHAGLETGEDGPTHADPQALQVLQGSFPPGACI